MIDWLLYQLADSAFPTGGFAHSAGLEAAWQAGEVPTRAALVQYVTDALWQAGCGPLPIVTAAHSDSARLSELDGRADAFLVNHVANRASRTQGRAFLETCARVFPAIAPLRERAKADALCHHHAPLFGAAMRLLELALIDTQRLYLSIYLRGLLGAAVRLGAVGTLDAQALQASLSPLLDRVLDQCGALPVEAIAQTAPVADLLSAAHDRLYSRLFVS